MIDELKNFFKKNHKRHLKTISKIIHNDYQTCEDIVQESYLKALKHWEKFDSDKSSLNTWFNYILFSTLRDFQRKHKLSFELTDEADEWWRIPSYNERGVNLENEINKYKCNETSRAVLMMFYVFGYSAKEVGSIEGVSVTNVTTICNRFKKHVESRYDVNLK